MVTPYEPLPLFSPEVRPYRCGMLASALVMRGHELRFWTSSFDHFSRAENRSCLAEPTHGTVSVECLCGKGYSRGASFRRFLHNKSLAKDFLLKARAINSVPDIIYTQIPSLELAESVVLYAKPRNIPVVVDVRDPWPDVYTRLLPGFAKWLAPVVFSSEYARLRRILANCAGITGVSETYLAWALAHADRPRTEADEVFPLGFPQQSVAAMPPEYYDEVRKNFGIPKDAFFAVFAGNFSSSMNLETVVAAAKILYAKHPGKIFFLLAGAGDSFARIKKLADNTPNLLLPGLLGTAVLNDLLRSADVGLAPYSSAAIQSLPNKPFEYMAASLPIISSLEGELKSLIERTSIGVHYTPDDVNGLVGCILRLSSNPAELEAMSNSSQKVFASDYRQEIIYARFSAYLETVSKQRTESVRC